jgi:hypothetical protein
LPPTRRRSGPWPGPEEAAWQDDEIGMFIMSCDLVTGTAVSWSGIYPERQTADVIKAEIEAARVLGAKGFVMFHLDHVYDEHWRTLKQATSATARP